jgi:putative polyketide hydroxylase
MITEQSLANSISMGRLASQPAGAALARPEYLNEQGMIFGASYESAAVIPDGTAPAPVANPVTDHVPSARPGARAPHVWLDREGARLSTLDLFGKGFVLLAGRGASEWRTAAGGVEATSRVPFEAFTVGGPGTLADPERRWESVYGVEADCAVLVRPDGHVAWRRRSGTAGAGEALRAAIAEVFGWAPADARRAG